MRYRLYREGFGLFGGERQIGEVYPAGPFTRRTRLGLPVGWAPAVRVFVFWLALVLRMRDANAGAAS